MFLRQCQVHSAFLRRSSRSSVFLIKYLLILINSFYFFIIIKIILNNIYKYYDQKIFKIKKKFIFVLIRCSDRLMLQLYMKHNQSCHFFFYISKNRKRQDLYTSHKCFYLFDNKNGTRRSLWLLEIHMLSASYLYKNCICAPRFRTLM